MNKKDQLQNGNAYNKFIMNNLNSGLSAHAKNRIYIMETKRDSD